MGRLEVTTNPGLPFNGGEGIEFSGSVRDSTIQVPTTVAGASAVRVIDQDTGTVQDSTLTGYYGVYGNSLGATATTVTVTRVHITAGYTGIYTIGTEITAEDVLIEPTPDNATVGVRAATGPLVDGNTTLRNLTVVGADVAVEAFANNANRTVSLDLNSSLIQGADTPLLRDANTGEANLTAAYSNYTGAVNSSGTGTLTESPGDTSFADPGFVSAAGGDFHLRASSPVLDLGDPAGFLGESATDLDGNPRFSNGRRDMGAFELQSSSPAPTKCAGKKATIVGTVSAEKLKGTAGRDVIAALGGNDTIRALGGNDLVCGGAAKDRLIGGGGRDRLLGEAGNDVIKGGARRDTLKGGAGRDRLIGGGGNDRLIGGAGRDSARQ
jgi:Ca2+-binding RTX toxin-like protein